MIFVGIPRDLVKERSMMGREEAAQVKGTQNLFISYQFFILQELNLQMLVGELLSLNLSWVEDSDSELSETKIANEFKEWRGDMINEVEYKLVSWSPT